MVANGQAIFPFALIIFQKQHPFQIIAQIFKNIPQISGQPSETWLGGNQSFIKIASFGEGFCIQIFSDY